ncbi:hypothetical protein HCN44_003728 [Aphidius gifuensis]|uniref:Tetraspanin n=1 Tax=Aphidius gifuensis TaxID=684658 RepID=A0A834XM36_APHGI|nr:uncharacterized protein LOC122858745 [Aphidius gifuensis]KAF7987865.1 hypothetical protein HCN44_003728 [Aphidius gifuensis]
MALSDFCIQYILFGCLILLGITGLIVCAAGSFFIYEFHDKTYSDLNIINYVDFPSVVLLLTGLLTFVLAIYFWKFIDFKYNYQQCMLFSVILLIIVAVEVASGLWALFKFEELETVLSTSLEQSLKDKETSIVSSHDEIQINCCNYNSTIDNYFDILQCCDFKRHDNTTKIECENYYGIECRHLAINHHRSILHRVFLLALSSISIQLIVLLLITNYFRSKKSLKKRRRTRQRKPTEI